MSTIKLDNNYYLEVTNDYNSLKTAVDIKNLKLRELNKRKVLLLKIDFNTFHKKDYKKLLKHLLFIKSLVLLRNQKVGIQKNSQKLIGFLVNYDKNNIDHNNFISAINAILYDTRYDRYNYIYDTACDYLDAFFYGKNLCDFEDNKCGEKRNTASRIGCCRHAKVKYLGPFSKLVPCEHLSADYTCGAKCISCKLFTCDYLQKKGIKFKVKNILLLNVFFNPIQKYFIKFMVFTPKEKILKRLMVL